VITILPLSSANFVCLRNCSDEFEQGPFWMENYKNLATQVATVFDPNILEICRTIFLISSLIF
jgi:hypothetical protein